MILPALLLLATMGFGEPIDTTIVRETIPVDGARGLVIDNFYGPITVKGASGNEIRVTATRRVHARTPEALERADREVGLDIYREDGRVHVCVDGPFRDPRDCSEWARDTRYDPDYRVVYEFEVEIPRRFDLSLRSIEGDLAVTGVRGAFAVHGVQGAIEMSDVAGSGEIRTVNGPVSIVFSENPSEDTEFGTVNGRIDVSFRGDLSADLSFDTMNGEVMTDFDYLFLSPRVRRSAPRGGDTVYRMEIESAIRIAQGGPRHTFTNINGDILIRRH